MAGIKDMRAKIIGSTNPLNIVRATMKGLTSQVTNVIGMNDLHVCYLLSLCQYRKIVVIY